MILPSDCECKFSSNLISDHRENVIVVYNSELDLSANYFVKISAGFIFVLVTHSAVELEVSISTISDRMIALNYGGFIKYTSDTIASNLLIPYH